MYKMKVTNYSFDPAIHFMVTVGSRDVVQTDILCLKRGDRMENCIYFGIVNNIDALPRTKYFCKKLLTL